MRLLEFEIAALILAAFLAGLVITWSIASRRS